MNDKLFGKYDVCNINKFDNQASLWVGKGYLNVSRDSSGELMVSLSEDGKKLAEEAEKTITPEEKKLVDEAVNIVNTLMQGDQPDEDIPF